ncbi:MAG: hypothetical protein HHJ13_00085 [Phycicoccus sp.]|nr:hypothetical protein [Phycicoccus sp.]
MSFPAEVLTVLVASPGDVSNWRDVVEREIQRWNGNGHARGAALIMLPVRWETDVVPLMAGDGQQVINEQLADQVDIVIAVFHSRLGTATPRSPSGTDEEIERARARQIPIHVYVDTSAVPRDHDPAQLQALRAYEKKLEAKGLVGHFASEQELTDQVRHALDHDAATRASPASAITVAGGAGAALLPADHRLLDILDDLLPEDSSALVWLRQSADGRSYHYSDVEPLRRFVAEWWAHDRHFLDDQVDTAAQGLFKALADYNDYQSVVSEWAPRELQTDPDDPFYRVPEVLFEERPDPGVQKRLNSLADDALAAYAAVRRMVNLRGR